MLQVKAFLQAKEAQDPSEMFKNIERLTKMVGRGLQPSLVITGGAGMGKTHIVKSTLEGMGLQESYDFVHFKDLHKRPIFLMTELNLKILVMQSCIGIQ